MTTSGHGQLLGEMTAQFQDVPRKRSRTGQADVRSFFDAEPAGTLCTCGLSVTSPSRPQPVSSPGTQWLKKKNPQDIRPSGAQGQG